MIDFHNHVLPNLDDGSKSMEMTLNMLREASSQGIKKIINTIHFQHPKMEGKNTDYEYVDSIKNQVLEEAKKNNIVIDIELAAEVYYLPNLCDLTHNPLLTINNYMLVEFPMIIIPENFLKVFFDLKLQGITPILAHPERYRFFQENMSELEKCIDMDIVLQLDAGSLIGHFGEKTRDVAFKMLSKGYCHIIGSDAHNDSKRNFCLKKAYDLIDFYNHDATTLLNKNSKILIEEKSNLIQVKVDIRRGFFQSLKNKFKFT